MSNKKVLITDCWTRKGLSAVRSLGSKGLEVHALSHTRLAPGLYSRYVSHYQIVPDPSKHPDQYAEKVMSLIRKEKFDCIIPLEESSTSIFLKNRTEIEKYSSLPLASEKSFHIANDKSAVLALAKQLNIPTPKTFCPHSEAELQQALAELDFPIIIKPTNSSGSRGLHKIKNREEFDRIYPLVQKKYGNPLIQECIDTSGQGVGVGILALNGKVLVDFSYKRLREFPVNGGPSTLRESTHQENIKRWAAQLVQELQWTGVAMVEFKTDPKDGVPKLMEINPRFWGSMDLAEVSGVHFPYLLYEMAMGKNISQPVYPSGIQCRWLFPGDIAHFIANPKRFKLQPSFFRFFDKNLYYDDFKKADWQGNLAAIVCTFLSIFDLQTWIIGVFRK